MKKAFLPFLPFFLSAQALLAATPGLYPKSSLTPGVVAPVTQAQVLKVGFTKDARHVTDTTKWEVLVRYKLAKGKLDHVKLSALLKQFEIDHFISLELGGANDAANLWPEYPPTPNPKDKVENALHAAVCDGRVKLTAAQNAIASNWQTAEQVLGLS